MTASMLLDVKSCVESGAVAVICVSLSTTNCAGSLSNVTLVAPVKPVPVMLTLTPPVAGTFEGDASVGVVGAPRSGGVGGGSPKVTFGAPASGLLPAGVVTMTASMLLDVKSCVESGAVAVICVSLSTTNCAGSLSNVTLVAPVQPVPVMVPLTPPPAVTFARDASVGFGGAI